MYYWVVFVLLLGFFVCLFVASWASRILKKKISQKQKRGRRRQSGRRWKPTRAERHTEPQAYLHVRSNLSQQLELARSLPTWAIEVDVTLKEGRDHNVKVQEDSHSQHLASRGACLAVRNPTMGANLQPPAFLEGLTARAGRGWGRGVGRPGDSGAQGNRVPPLGPHRVALAAEITPASCKNFPENPSSSAQLRSNQPPSSPHTPFPTRRVKGLPARRYLPRGP